MTSNVTLSISESTRRVFQASIEDEQRYSVCFFELPSTFIQSNLDFCWLKGGFYDKNTLGFLFAANEAVRCNYLGVPCGIL